MVLESISQQIISTMRVNGLMITNMGMERKNGQMELSIRVNIKMGKSMDLVLYYLLINHLIMVLSLMTKYKGVGHINGQTKKSIKENGPIIRCMVLVVSHGLTAENMLDNGNKENKKELASFTT